MLLAIDRQSLVRFPFGGQPRAKTTCMLLNCQFDTFVQFVQLLDQLVLTQVNFVKKSASFVVCVHLVKLLRRLGTVCSIGTIIGRIPLRAGCLC
jgi:hypothetical protein